MINGICANNLEIHIGIYLYRCIFINSTPSTSDFPPPAKKPAKPSTLVKCWSTILLPNLQEPFLMFFWQPIIFLLLSWWGLITDACTCHITPKSLNTPLLLPYKRRRTPKMLVILSWSPPVKSLIFIFRLFLGCLRISCIYI